MAAKCNWEMDGKVDENGAPVECGRKVHAVFSREVKVMGKTVRPKYRRCKMHSSDKVIQYAELNGYTIDYVEVPDATE